MSDLEKFLHADELPVLIRAGLAHAQFETIHPFLDGNGRIGRMLIVLMFLAEGLLAQPLLYLSLHFKRHREVYYELLQAIRTKGAWEDWLEFFVGGVTAVADDAVRKMQELLSLFARDRSRVSGARSGGSTFQQAALKWNLDVFDHLRLKVAVTIADTTAACGSTKPTVARALDELVRLGIAREATGKQRNRVFVYDEYLKILDRGS
jgi:Fic family protein